MPALLGTRDPVAACGWDPGSLPWLSLHDSLLVTLVSWLFARDSILSPACPPPSPDSSYIPIRDPSVITCDQSPTVLPAAWLESPLALPRWESQAMITLAEETCSRLLDQTAGDRRLPQRNRRHRQKLNPQIPHKQRKLKSQSWYKLSPTKLQIDPTHDSGWPQYPGFTNRQVI